MGSCLELLFRDGGLLQGETLAPGVAVGIFPVGVFKEDAFPGFGKALPGLCKVGATFEPTGMVDPVCLLVPLDGLELGLLLIPETAGILLVDLLPLAAIGRVAVEGLVGVALVGVVLERAGALGEERPNLALTGRNPLVDLLSRSEIGDFVGVFDATEVPVTWIRPRDTLAGLIEGTTPCDPFMGMLDEGTPCDPLMRLLDKGSFFLCLCKICSFFMRKSIGSGGNSFTTFDIKSSNKEDILCFVR